MNWLLVLIVHRYTDFLVNEIRKDGKVLHLEDYVEAERPTELVCAVSLLEISDKFRLTYF